MQSFSVEVAGLPSFSSSLKLRRTSRSLMYLRCGNVSEGVIRVICQITGIQSRFIEFPTVALVRFPINR